MKRKFTDEQLSDLIIWFERYDRPSPNFIKSLSLKYPEYKFFELDDGNFDYTWILAKNKKMAAELINKKEIKSYGEGNNMVYNPRNILDI